MWCHLHQRQASKELLRGDPVRHLVLQQRQHHLRNRTFRLGTAWAVCRLVLGRYSDWRSTSPHLPAAEDDGAHAVERLEPVQLFVILIIRLRAASPPCQPLPLCRTPYAAARSRPSGVAYVIAHQDHHDQHRRPDDDEDAALPDVEAQVDHGIVAFGRRQLLRPELRQRGDASGPPPSYAPEPLPWCIRNAEGHTNGPPRLST